MEYKLTLMGETQINLFRLLMNARIATTMKVCHKQKKFINFQANWFIFHVARLARMFPCSPSEIPTLLLVVTCTIIFQPGSTSPPLPHLILRPRFCCGSRTVLMCKISFNPLKVNIGEKIFIQLCPRSGFFLTLRLVNRLLNSFLIPLLIG